ncbi:CBS domain-containing protein [Zunongwangia sp. F363]|uniref:CBS domain-containing protein n=1 Tax=Autumnicola tepida TaxID=3075595 RepID=A0ABU3CCP9_9FLAO|nr:CBS domain-containing protein [Zunongwangia sp. F363]MDT0644105.1 CBS domain-containing protein [Zunongwangia sp. F363]
MAVKSFQGKRAEPEKPAEPAMLVEDYMSTSLITFRKEEKVVDVIEKLIENNISGGPVVNENDELLGIISEGDCLKQISDSRYYNMPMEDLTVEKHMTCNVETIDGKMNVLDAAKKFIELKRRRFPILQDGKLVGQISQRDVLRAALQLKGDTWWG